jgi:hypothetical protein
VSFRFDCLFTPPLGNFHVAQTKIVSLTLVSGQSTAGSTSWSSTLIWDHRALVARDSTIEPQLHLADRPLVLNGEAQHQSTVHGAFSMKVQASKLHEHSAFINLNPFGLIMMFVSLRKCITRLPAPEATNGPKIF